MFSNRLEILRAENGLTLKEVSVALNIPLTTYRNYEKDEREPNSETLIKIANYFDVSLDWFLGMSEYRVLSHAKEFAEKDTLSVDIYRKFCECISRYKSFYAKCFGHESDCEEFKPPMCEVIYRHAEKVCQAYMQMFNAISTCTTDDDFKNCVKQINYFIDKLSEVKSDIIDETYELYQKRNDF